MTPERRAYQREYARKRRAERLAAKNAGATHCAHRQGPHGRCGARLETLTDGSGRTSIVCPACDRRERGICRDCPRPVAGTVRKSIRCATHAKVAKDASWRKHRANDPEAHNRASRRNYQKSAERRRRKNEYKKLWRRANPEKVKAYKRRESLRDNAKRKAYHVARRAREREQLAARERARYHDALDLRTCVVPGCDIVVTHRKKKCRRCIERERHAAVALLAPTAGRGRRTDLEPGFGGARVA